MEKYFVFMYLSFTTCDDIKNSINIPYINILRKLYNEIYYIVSRKDIDRLNTM